MTSFVGRERETAVLNSLLRDPQIRLITLTGVGGVGKTRLALRAAAELEADDFFTDGAIFIDLAPIRDPRLVIPTIAQALNVRGGQDTVSSALKAFLGKRHLLLILDNFEQVSEAGPGLIDLLQSCPGLTLLVTSRSLLNLSGEQVMPVPPLGVGRREAEDEGNVGQPGSQASASEAVRLFAERTAALNPRFTLSAANEPLIAEIVQRLDGLPLAIELAAARGTLLSPTELLARLARPLTQLSGGRRDQPERHQTMRAAISWSYELLPPEEQRVFRALGVFAGGCTLEAITSVCSPVVRTPDNRGEAASVEVELLVDSLVRQSLLRSVTPPEALQGESSVRVVMLETIREFAVEQLALRGEDAAVRDRHAAWYLDVVEELDLHHTMQGDVARMSRLAPEQDNLRQALAWYAERGDAVSLNRLSAALAIFWFDRGQFAEARTWLHQAIALDEGVPVLTRARAWSEAGWLAMCQGELDLAQRLRAQALELAREAREPFLLADAIFRNGILAFWQGDLARASVQIEEARLAFLEIGTEFAAPVKAAAAVNLLGGIALVARNVPLAIQRGEEAVGMARALGAGADLGYALSGLGYALLQAGDVAGAAACFLEATALTWMIRDDVFLARLLWAMAAVAAAQQHFDTAARLIGKADALDMRTGSAMWPNDRALAERCLAQIENALDGALLSALRSSGASLAVEQAVIASQGLAATLLGEERAGAIWRTTGAPDLSAGSAVTTAGDDEGSRMRTGHNQIIGRERDGGLAMPPSDADLGANVGLTARELEVLREIGKGHSDREVAERLFITRRTASKHVEAILAKLGVSSRGAAVAEARRLKLVPAVPSDVDA